MKKRIVTFLMALVLVFSLVPAVAVNANTGRFTPVTGWDMMERLGIGYTFGNTTDARDWPWIDWETDNQEDAWGQPRIRAWHFESIAMKGFDSYRLCVTWTTRMDDNYRIDPAWMNRVQYLVDAALDAGLYVILNTHHEEELYWLVRDDEFERAERHLNAIWTQVAARFADYNERLIFEIMNETNVFYPHYAEGPLLYRDGHHPCPRLVEITDRINMSALNVIRNSGGNNAQRVVMLAVAGAHPESLPMMYIPNDPHIMVGVFGYYGYFMNERNKGYIEAILNRGIGIVNKEDNAMATGGGLQEFANPAGHTRSHFGWFADRGIPSIWFAGCITTGGAYSHGHLLNRITGEWGAHTLLAAFFAAYGKIPGADFVPPERPSHTIYTRSNVTVSNRQNSWEGVDIALPAGMNFSVNDYIITVSGRVVNAAPATVTTMTLNGQDAPWNWLSTRVTGNGSFTFNGDMGITYGVVNPRQFNQGFRLQTYGEVLSDFVVDSFTIERVGEAPTPTPTPTRPPGTYGVSINGVEHIFDPPPQEIGGRMMLPFRAIGEALGMTVRSLGGGVVSLTAPGIEVTHITGTEQITVNGAVQTFPGMASVVDGGRTLMSVRMVAVAIGADVRWDRATLTAVITTN